MRTLVIGGAVSGRAAATLATRLGHEVVGYDRDPDAAATMGGHDGRWAGGEWTADLLEGVDVVVTSPGVPPASPPLVDALESGRTVWSELEFGARHATATIAAITGTNGKTSAVTAAVSMLEESGAKACAAGNIGRALCDVAQEPWEVIVVEASSFQLEFTESFHPGAAAILNVTPDHLDWHGTAEDYLEAKARITANQTAADLLVYGVDDEGAATAAAASRADTIPVSGMRVPAGGAGMSEGTLEIDGRLYPAPDLGADFLLDLVAAAVVAGRVGATGDGIRNGLAAFRPGPHRRSIVGEWDGVIWVDESKATNPHAALASASAFESVVLIAGGQNKGLDLSPMAGMASVRHVFTIGETAAELARGVRGSTERDGRFVGRRRRRCRRGCGPGGHRVAGSGLCELRHVRVVRGARRRFCADRSREKGDAPWRVGSPRFRGRPAPGSPPRLSGMPAIGASSYCCFPSPC